MPIAKIRNFSMQMQTVNEAWAELFLAFIRKLIDRMKDALQECFGT